MIGSGAEDPLEREVSIDQVICLTILEEITGDDEKKKGKNLRKNNEYEKDM